MNEKHPARRRRLEPNLFLISAMLLTFGALAGIGISIFNVTRRDIQLQDDPNLASVWVIGVTRGAQQTLTHGGLLQKQLNHFGIHALGDYQVFQSGHSGDPNGLEIWFDYTSHLVGADQLECHRIGQTAFEDDLGQRYHGYLDFHNKIVGVYLPGYDHAAHKIYCKVRWMPRGKRFPVSRPMTFVVDLPPVKRVLPPVASLPRGSIWQQAQGVTVTVRDAELSPPDLTTNYLAIQRRLTFHLKISGGEPANSNLPDLRYESTTRSTITLSLNGRVLRSGPQVLPPSPPQIQAAIRNVFPENSSFCTITDPYGIPLVDHNNSLRGNIYYMDNSIGSGVDTDYAFAVTGAGKGTDVVRLHLDVHPLNTPANKTIPFDLIVPVHLAAPNALPTMP